MELDLGDYHWRRLEGKPDWIVADHLDASAVETGGLSADTGDLQCTSDELSKWARAAANRIRELAHGTPPKRIVEVGCGTGMLAVQLAAEFEFVGIDPVASAVHRLSSEMPQATFLVGTASDVPASYLDGALVVINSVAQYFPSQAYLKAALQRYFSLGAVAIFVGDVRAAELLASQRLAALNSRREGAYATTSLPRGGLPASVSTPC